MCMHAVASHLRSKSIHGERDYLESTDKFADVTVTFDNCDLAADAQANPRYRLTVSIDGNDVTISELGEVSGAARYGE